jgi:hypothetical protein
VSQAEIGREEPAGVGKGRKARNNQFWRLF